MGFKKEKKGKIDHYCIYRASGMGVPTVGTSRYRYYGLRTTAGRCLGLGRDTCSHFIPPSQAHDGV